jgi:hypothetical protein
MASTYSLQFNTSVTKVKVKQSHHRLGQGQSVPGGWRSQISRKPAHEGGRVVSPTHRPPLPPRKYGWYSFLLWGWVNPRAIVRPEEWCHWKIPLTPSGIELSAMPQPIAPPRTPHPLLPGHDFVWPISLITTCPSIKQTDPVTCALSGTCSSVHTHLQSNYPAGGSHVSSWHIVC